MRVEVRHPVVQTGIKRGNGRDRVGYAHVTSPMELRCLSPSEVDESFPATSDRSGYAVIDGALWVRPALVGRTCTVEESLEWLSGRGRGRVASALAGALEASPVSEGSHAPRDWPVIDVGWVAPETLDAATASVAAFLDANLRVVDDGVLVRADGPGVVREGVDWSHAEFARRLAPRRPHVRLDLATEEEAEGRAREGLDGIKAIYDGVPTWLAGDADVSVVANRLPEIAAGILDDYARFARWSGAGKALGDRRRALLGLRTDGLVGMVRGDDVARSISLCADAFRHVIDVHPAANREASRFLSRRNPLVQGLSEATRFLDYAERVALPRLAESASPTPDDLEALAGMSM